MSILNKPQKKTNFAIMSSYDHLHKIYVQTTKELANKYLLEFGNLINYEPDKYSLSVDYRFDFDEVVKYIKKIENEEKFRNVRS